MRSRWFALWVGSLLSLSSLPAACAVDEHANSARGCEGCKGECLHGFCVMIAASVAGGGGAAADGGSGGMLLQGKCTTDGDTHSCYTGQDGTEAVGACKAGAQVCRGGRWGACNGDVTPTEEICNALDEDCDGRVDEDIELGPCPVNGFLAATPCATGKYECVSGLQVCKESVFPTPEICNGADDDCDALIDENTDVPCYDGTSGCTSNSKGAFTCLGACHIGMRHCESGKPAKICSGEIKPAAKEDCSAATAIDDDCNGKIDETCTCTQSQKCYRGPDGTVGRGECKAGTQTCNATTHHFDACSGDVAPATEICDGLDNDCNDLADDLPGRGDPCMVPNAKGPCQSGTLDCVGSNAMLVCKSLVASTKEVCDGLDNDCDGTADNGFDLQGDENNCGACGKKCAGGETCCGGVCSTLSSDEKNCGACGTICGMGLTCCTNKCVDTTSDPQNCATCGKACLTLLGAIGSCSASVCKL